MLITIETGKIAELLNRQRKYIRGIHEKNLINKDKATTGIVTINQIAKNLISLIEKETKGEKEIEYHHQEEFTKEDRKEFFKISGVE